MPYLLGHPIFIILLGGGVFVPNIDLSARIKCKRDYVTNWSTNNPTLLNGECVVVDMGDNSIRIKIGDGIHNFTSLSYLDDDLRNTITEINSVPSCSASDNGKVLSVVNGSPTWVSMSIQQYYTGTAEPTADIGDDGDLYLQTP